MRTAAFKRIKLKPIDSFRNAKWTAEEGSALQLRPAWRGRSQPGRQDGDFYLYVVRHIFGCLADMALIRQNKQIRGGALAHSTPRTLFRIYPSPPPTFPIAPAASWQTQIRQTKTSCAQIRCKFPTDQKSLGFISWRGSSWQLDP